MFSSGFKSTKLKTNLRLSINRLKLLEKKKTEMALKSRKEIADYLAAGKDERARIRVEHIIREDYYVEAMEVVEMYCDLLLARMGLLETMKVVDEGIAEAVSSLLWVAPRMQTDVAELKIVSEQLTGKYGKEYALACRSDQIGTVNERLKHKLSVKAPPKSLVENYLVEIAKSHNVAYEPDPMVLDGGESLMLDIGDDGPGGPPEPPKGGGGGGGNGGGGQKQPLGQPAPYGAYPPPPPMDDTYGRPTDAMAPPYNGMSAAAAPSVPHTTMPNTPAPPYSANDPAYPPPQFNGPPVQPQGPPGGVAPSGIPPGPSPMEGLPELPSVPAASFPPLDNTVGADSAGGEDVDFDDLSRRFEELKKKK